MVNFGGGFGEGWSRGMAAGTGMAETNMRGQLLQQQMVDEKLEMVKGVADQGLKNIVDLISGASHRTPDLDRAVEAYSAQLTDIASQIGQFGDKGQVLASAIQNQLNYIKTNVKTQADANTSENVGKLEGAKGTIAAIRGQQQAAPQAQAQPQPQQGEPMRLGPPAGMETEEETAAAVTAAAPPTQVAQAQPQAAPTNQYGVDERALMYQLLGLDDPEKAYKTRLQEKQADMDMEQQEFANDAVKILEENQIARGLLDEGIYTGTGATAYKEVAKFFNPSSEKVGRTEQFEAGRIVQSMKVLKQMGAGTGLSDADREAANKAVAGNIDLSEGGIRNILRIMDEMATEVISKYQTRYPDRPLPAPNLTMGQQRPGAPAPAPGQPPAAASPQVGKDGWLDIGGGVRIRQKQ